MWHARSGPLRAAGVIVVLAAAVLGGAGGTNSQSPHRVLSVAEKEVVQCPTGDPGCRKTTHPGN